MHFYVDHKVFKVVVSTLLCGCKFIYFFLHVAMWLLGRCNSVTKVF